MNLQYKLFLGLIDYTVLSFQFETVKGIIGEIFFLNDASDVTMTFAIPKLLIYHILIKISQKVINCYQ